MRLKNGRVVQRKFPSSGTQGWVAWIDDCFDPPLYFLRGDSAQDATDQFLADPTIEAQQAVGEPDLTEMRPKLEAGEWVSGVTFNDNGTLVYDEDVIVVPWALFMSASRLPSEARR